MKPLHRFLFFLSLLVQTQKVVAQDSASAVAVLVSPAVFMPVSVAVQAGLQFRLSGWYSLLVEGAVPTFYPKMDDYEKVRYWRGSVTLKHWPKQPSVRGRYYAVQTGYLLRTLTNEGDGYVHYKNGEYHYDAATVHSNVLSTAVLVGRELGTPKSRFYADVYIGAGARFIFNRYVAKNLLITSGVYRPPDGLGFIPEEGWIYGYNLTRLHLTAAVKIGVRL